MVGQESLVSYIVWVDKVERMSRYGLVRSRLHLKIPALLKSFFASFMVINQLVNQLMLRIVKYHLIIVYLAVYLIAISAWHTYKLIHV